MQRVLVGWGARALIVVKSLMILVVYIWNPMPNISISRSRENRKKLAKFQRHVQKNTKDWHYSRNESVGSNNSSFMRERPHCRITFMRLNQASDWAQPRSLSDMNARRIRGTSFRTSRGLFKSMNGLIVQRRSSIIMINHHTPQWAYLAPKSVA